MEGKCMRFAGLNLIIVILATNIIAQKREPPFVKLKGQVVCSQCYFEADRKVTSYGSKADVECAIRCAKKRVPIALVVEGQTEAVMYFLENKKSAEEWINYLGKQIEVIGVVTEKDKKHYLKVYTLNAQANVHESK
jgi:hypothetical protein